MKSYNVIDDSFDDEEFEEETEEQEEINPEFIQDEDTWQVFSELKVDDSFAIGNVSGTKNIYENFKKSKLLEDLYVILEDSPYKDKYDVKKPAKSDMVDIVIYFLDRIHDSESYTMCEKVVAIAELMKMDLLTMFNELPTLLRYNIMKELNEQFNLEENRSKKLF